MGARGMGQQICSVVAAIAIALSISGCGGGSGETEAGKAPVTQKQFEQLAHKVCYHAYKKQARLTEAFSNRRGFRVAEPTQEQREVVNRVIVMPIVREKISKLSALPLPPGDKPKMEAVIASMRRGIRMTEAHPEWLAAPTEAHPETFAEARETTRALGIWVCGQA
jgi:hypothetical protein